MTPDEAAYAKPGEVVFSLAPAWPRLLLGVTLTGCLSATLIAIALGDQGSGIGRLFFGAGGLGSVFLTARMWRARLTTLELTPEALFETGGGTRVLARIKDIAKVERGALAMKPPAGFVVHLRDTQDRAWVPGLWWRIGRRVGVGGMVGAGQARAMAEFIEILRIRSEEGPET